MASKGNSDRHETMALHLLDGFLADRHDRAIEMQEFLKRDRPKRDRKIFTWLILVFTLSCSAVYFTIHKLFNGIEDITAIIVALLVGLLTSFTFNSEANARLHAKVLSAVRSHVGYLHRANDFAALLRRVYKSNASATIYASERGYDSLIGSLNVMIEGVRAEANFSRARNQRIINALGVLAAIIALIGTRGGAG